MHNNPIQGNGNGQVPPVGDPPAGGGGDQNNMGIVGVHGAAAVPETQFLGAWRLAQVDGRAPHVNATVLLSNYRTQPAPVDEDDTGSDGEAEVDPQGAGVGQAAPDLQDPAPFVIPEGALRIAASGRNNGADYHSDDGYIHVDQMRVQLNPAAPAIAPENDSDEARADSDLFSRLIQHSTLRRLGTAEQPQLELTGDNHTLLLDCNAATARDEMAAEIIVRRGNLETYSKRNYARGEEWEKPIRNDIIPILKREKADLRELPIPTGTPPLANDPLRLNTTMLERCWMLEFENDGKPQQAIKLTIEPLQAGAQIRAATLEMAGQTTQLTITSDGDILTTNVGLTTPVAALADDLTTLRNSVLEVLRNADIMLLTSGSGAEEAKLILTQDGTTLYFFPRTAEESAEA